MRFRPRPFSGSGECGAGKRLVGARANPAQGQPASWVSGGFVPNPERTKPAGPGRSVRSPPDATASTPGSKRWGVGFHSQSPQAACPLTDKKRILQLRCRSPPYPPLPFAGRQITRPRTRLHELGFFPCQLEQAERRCVGVGRGLSKQLCGPMTFLCLRVPANEPCGAGLPSSLGVVVRARIPAVGVGADIQSWSQDRNFSRSDAVGEPICVAGSGFQVRAYLASPLPGRGLSPSRPGRENTPPRRPSVAAPLLRSLLLLPRLGAEEVRLFAKDYKKQKPLCPQRADSRSPPPHPHPLSLYVSKVVLSVLLLTFPSCGGRTLERCSFGRRLLVKYLQWSLWMKSLDLSCRDCVTFEKRRAVTSFLCNLLPSPTGCLGWRWDVTLVGTDFMSTSS